MAKAGGVDIEGSVFVPCDMNSSNRKEHKLLLGLRGPLTNDGEAIVLTIGIPKNGLFNPKTWVFKDSIDILNLNNFGIRDMTLDYDTGDVFILAGSLNQDKSNKEIDGYPVYKWKIGKCANKVKKGKCDSYQGTKIQQVGKISRLENGKIDHQGIYSKKWEEYGIPESDIRILENDSDFTSPEGFDFWNYNMDAKKKKGSGDKNNKKKKGKKYNQKHLLVVWDNNDVGLYGKALLNTKHYKPSTTKL